MFVIRGLMNHLVIVFVGVLIVVGIVNKDKIKTELTQMGYLDSQASDVASTSSFAEETSKSEAPAVEPKVAVSSPAPAAPAEAPKEQASQAMPTHLTAQVAAPASALAQAQQAPAQAPYYAQQQQMQQRLQHQMQARQSQAAQTAEVALDADIKTQWAAARAAYWQRDLDKAEDLYKALLESSDEAGIAGELGNIYYTHRRFEDAANMFYEAGLRHLKSDTPQQANVVMGPLSQLDRQKADQLRTKLMELQRKNIEALNEKTEPTKD